MSEVVRRDGFQSARTLNPSEPSHSSARQTVETLMKTLLSIAGTIVAALALFVLYARVFGFEPGATRPGMWLKGEVVRERVTDWSFAEKIPGLARVETKQWFFPALAHSVRAGAKYYRGRLYIASGYPAGIPLPAGRHWNRNVLANQGARVGIGDKIYPVRLVYVTDAVERDECLRAWGPLYWSPGFQLHMWRAEPLDERARTGS